MGAIIFWALIRLIIVIPSLWYLTQYIEYKFWWIITALSVFLIVLYPAFIAYRKFIEINQKVIESSLCSTCKHFDASAVLCMKHDKHPTSDFIPCEGEHWEPK
ncbi:MAG: hypothetical protein JXA68_01765 [Ignavibacteriales bacterium]|nr:hypothetical protein [Ignavibacteriales bacterium]